MQRPIKPDWLLRQADELAGRTAGVGQPRNADLRRAVSAAYYALFHLVVLSAARQLLPRCADDDHYRLTRQFEHAAVTRVCKWVVPPQQPPERVRDAMLSVRGIPDLVDFADAFIQLQEARHEGDYDHLADFSRPGALALIDMARGASAVLEALQETREVELLLTYLALGSRLQ